MKKLFVIGAIAVGTMASAFPFRTTCNMVFEINPESVKNMTPERLEHTLKQLNYSACGVVPNKIIFYTSSNNTN